MQKSPENSLNHRKPPLDAELGERNVFANNEREKIKAASETPAFSKRYTEKDHRENINKKEITLITRKTIVGDKNRENIEEKIRPPSKPYMGSIFNVPKAIEYVMNSLQGSVSGKRAAREAVRKLARGPPRQRNISEI